jgi:hypothetical protein
MQRNYWISIETEKLGLRNSKPYLDTPNHLLLDLRTLALLQFYPNSSQVTFQYTYEKEETYSFVIPAEYAGRESHYITSFVKSIEIENFYDMGNFRYINLLAVQKIVYADETVSFYLSGLNQPEKEDMHAKTYSDLLARMKKL